MNKTISIGVMFLLILSMGVLAAGNQYQNAYSSENKPTIEPERIQEMNKEMVSAKIQEKIQSNIEGLNNMNIRVQTRTEQGDIKNDIEQWQNRYRYRYEYAEATMVGDTAMIRTRNTHRFLGLFEVKAENTYELNKEGGEIKNQKRNFWSYIFRERMIGE